MQALTFARTLKRIATELKARELADFLAPYLKQPPVNAAVPDGPKDEFSTLIVASIEGLSTLNRDPDAKKNIDRLGVTDIYSAPRIGRLLGLFSSTQNQTQFLATTNFFEFTSFSALLSSLVRLSDATAELLERERIPQLGQDRDIVEFEIVAVNHAVGFDPERLRRFLVKLTDLHSQFAQLLGIPDSRLEIVYVDSGSILIGIATAVGIASALKGLFSQIWKEVKYAPHDNLDRNVESLSKVLSVTKEIDAQVAAKALDENVGKALKHKIIEDAVAIIEIGAMIPAKEPAEEEQQQKLLSERTTKLLTAGETPSEEGPFGEERKI